MPEFGQLDILQHEVMTGIVEKFKRPAFIGGSLFPEKKVLSNTSKWDIIEHNRDMADFSVPGAPAKIVNRRGVKSQTATQAYIREKKQLDGVTMAWLRKPGTEHQQWKDAAVGEELDELDSRLEFRKEWMRWQAMTGTITVAQDDVMFVIDERIDTTHKNAVAAVTWATATTDIPGDIRTCKRLINADSGAVCTEAYANESVMVYLQKNNYVKDKMGDSMKNQIATTGYITRFMGLTWTWYDIGYVPASTSTFTRFIADDYVFFTTPPGTFAREDTGPATDPKANFRPGKFSKSWEEEDPAGVWVLEEQSFIPIVTHVNKLVRFDTTT